MTRKGYSCSHAVKEGGGAGHHDGQQLHAPRPGAEDGRGGGEGCVQGGGPVDALQVGECPCPWYPEPVYGDSSGLGSSDSRFILLLRSIVTV